MKKTKSARRLVLSKQTVAHVDDEQMSGARGGGATDTCVTCITCSKTGGDTVEVCTLKDSGVTYYCD
jgi:hypothetical protein